MIASLLANEYVSAFGYIVGVISGCIAIYQTTQVTKKNNEIKQLNVTIKDLNSQIINITTNRNNINQGERSQYFQDNNGPVNIDNQPRVLRASVIGKLIEIISNPVGGEQSLNRKASNIDVKISFNDLKRNRWVAELYKEDALLVDESIKTLDTIILNGSVKLKRQFRGYYNTALGLYGLYEKPFNIEVIRKNSDNIIDNVIRSAQETVSSCSNLDAEFLQEDIDYGIRMIVSYSIIECIVLENPNDYN